MSMFKLIRGDIARAIEKVEMAKVDFAKLTHDVESVVKAELAKRDDLITELSTRVAELATRVTALEAKLTEGN